MRSVYIAGPMRGIPKYNFPAFLTAEDLLYSLGHYDRIYNPAKRDLGMGFDPEKSLEEQGFDLSASFCWDFSSILLADEVYFLAGWQHSEGAKAEWLVAKLCGKAIRYEDPGDIGLDHKIRTTWALSATSPTPATLNTSSENCLEEANRIVSGDRQRGYGHPMEDFTRTGKMWSAILGHEVPPEKVALMMIAVKMSRECNAPKRDNVVDIAGYARTLEMVRDRQGAY